MKPIVAALPEYDYMYLGDTANLPYGDKSQEQIYAFTKRALDYLFAHDCALVLVMCNTASALALRRLQHEGYRALGIIIPTVESVHGKRIGILGTQSTVDSGKYLIELKKVLPDAQVFQQAAPLLVPMIESGTIDKKIVDQYVEPLMQKKIDTLILACTHYGAIKKYLPTNINTICQEDIIAPKVTDYLRRHPEIESKLSRGGRRDYLITAHHPAFEYLGDLDRSLFRLVVLHDGGDRAANC